MLKSLLSLALPWMPSEAQPAPLAPVRLPFDEQPHANAIEWWHFMGYVDKLPPKQTDSSYAPERRLSFVVSVLKAQKLGLSNIVGLAILIDHEKRTYDVSSQLSPIGACYFEPTDGRRFRFHFGPAGASRPDSSPAWEVAGGMGVYSINISTSEQLALNLRQKTPAVLLGRERLDGIMSYDGSDAMAYYVWPDIEVTGIRGVGTKQIQLRGQAWMDHQWGDMRVGDYRWKYLAIVLFVDNGGVPTRAGQLLLFRTDKNGPCKSYGVWIETDGHYSIVEEVAIDHGRNAYAGYPLETSVELNGIRSASTTHPNNASLPSSVKATLTVKPIFTEQECTTQLSATFFPRFWEGACTVDGTFNGDNVNSDHSWAITEIAGYR
jgi:predicted secreted hydrolase